MVAVVATQTILLLSPSARRGAYKDSKNSRVRCAILLSIHGSAVFYIYYIYIAPPGSRLLLIVCLSDKVLLYGYICLLYFNYVFRCVHVET